MEAPSSFQRIPDRHIRCFTNILQAASVTPEPIQGHGKNPAPATRQKAQGTSSYPGLHQLLQRMSH